MKTETKELMRLFGIAILVMVALPLVYRGYIFGTYRVMGISANK